MSALSSNSSHGPPANSVTEGNNSHRQDFKTSELTTRLLKAGGLKPRTESPKHGSKIRLGVLYCITIVQNGYLLFRVGRLDFSLFY